MTMSAPKSRPADEIAEIAVLEDLRRSFAARRPLRAGSLIVTVFGDLILPRGGGVRLAGLLSLLERLGVNDSQTRTALSRLVADGWFTAERVGRESFYRLTPLGQRRFDEASRRIYRDGSPAWDGVWHLALLPEVTRERRQAVERLFAWAGFGQLGPGVMIHPAPDRDSLAALLADLVAEERPLMVAGPAVALPPEGALRSLVARAWNLTALASAYGGFVEAFTPLTTALRQVAPTPEEAVLARVLLIHEYRRLILRDPFLPTQTLHQDWVGRAAHGLAADIYHRVLAPAETWIDRACRDRDGGPMPAAVGVRERFGREMSQKS